MTPGRCSLSTRTSSASNNVAPTRRVSPPQSNPNATGDTWGTPGALPAPLSDIERVRLEAGKRPLIRDFLAETEGFEPSVPVRGLHLSRVVH